MGLLITHYYQREIQSMAHCNTIFHQMLKFIPRHRFEALEGHHSTGRKSRHFSRWNQFVHLMFMQLTGRASLRDGIQSMISRAPNLHPSQVPLLFYLYPMKNNLLNGNRTFPLFCIAYAFSIPPKTSFSNMSISVSLSNLPR